MVEIDPISFTRGICIETIRKRRVSPIVSKGYDLGAGVVALGETCDKNFFRTQLIDESTQSRRGDLVELGNPIVGVGLSRNMVFRDRRYGKCQIWVALQEDNFYGSRKSSENISKFGDRGDDSVRVRRSIGTSRPRSDSDPEQLKVSVFDFRPISIDDVDQVINLSLSHLTKSISIDSIQKDRTADSKGKVDFLEISFNPFDFGNIGRGHAEMNLDSCVG